MAVCFCVIFFELFVHFQIVDIIGELLGPLRLYQVGVLALFLPRLVSSILFVFIFLNKRLGSLGVHLQLIQEVCTDLQIGPA